MTAWVARDGVVVHDDDWDTYGDGVDWHFKHQPVILNACEESALKC